MDKALIRFFTQPVMVKRARPSQRLRRAFWWLLLGLWPALNVADVVTTALALAHGAREGNLVTAALLAHNALLALALKVLVVVGAVIGMARVGFLWLPRIALLFVAACSAVIGLAVGNNVVLLISLALGQLVQRRGGPATRIALSGTAAQPKAGAEMISR